CPMYPITHLSPSSKCPQPNPRPFRYFFFNRSRPHRHPHSFPTRRSSDLTLCWDISQREPWGRNRQNTRNIRKGFDTFTALGPWRSEEHTSELQSQSNLVCRLLLEKKN